MTATFEQAYDDTLDIFKAAWDTTGFVVDYENVAPEDGVDIPPKTPTPWARASLRHATGGQTSLSGGLGKRTYTRTGVFIVQIFVPLGENLSEAQQLAKVVVDAFDGKASPRAVWYRNVRVNEIGSDGDWFQVNVLVDFTYDEIK